MYYSFSQYLLLGHLSSSIKTKNRGHQKSKEAKGSEKGPMNFRINPSLTVSALETEKVRLVSRHGKNGLGSSATDLSPLSAPTRRETGFWRKQRSGKDALRLQSSETAILE
jgi:hypothetical protein